MLSSVREPEREQELRDGRDHPDPERVLDRVPEVRVVEERGVVVEPDEVRRRVRAGSGRSARPTPCSRAGRARRREEQEERRDVEVRRDGARRGGAAGARCRSRPCAPSPTCSTASLTSSPPSTCVHPQTTPASAGRIRAVDRLSPAPPAYGLPSRLFLTSLRNCVHDFAGVCLCCSTRSNGVRGRRSGCPPWCGPRICGFSLSAELAKILPTGALLKNGFLKFWTAGLLQQRGLARQVAGLLEDVRLRRGRGQELDQVGGLVLVRALLRDGRGTSRPSCRRRRAPRRCPTCPSSSGAWPWM